METNVLDFFEQGALRSHPDKVGFSDASDQFSFAEIARHAKNIAATIVGRLPGRNRAVAVILPKTARCLVADLGILYSGNYYMNMDDAAPAPRMQRILADIGPGLLVTTKADADRIAALGYPRESMLFVEDLFLDGIQHNEADLRQRVVTGIDTDPVCIINTSGSTGIPKSVVLTHRGLIDFINWWKKRFDFSEHEVVGSLSPFFFDGYIVGFLMTLNKGARIEVLPTQLATFPAKLVQLMAERGVTFIFWVPSIMVVIANFDIFSQVLPRNLRTVCFAGEVFPTRHLNYWRRHLPEATFINLYGPIEISVICTYYVVDRPFRDDEPVPIGEPCANTDVIVLGDGGVPAPVNEPGELFVRGSSVALGYWRNPEATARAFVQNPLHNDYPETVYRTGDIVYHNEDGQLMFVGRRDFQVKHMGNRFDLGEIEHFVLQIPGVRHACVCYNAQQKEIHLFFEAERAIPAGDIRKLLSPSLPKYMWPTHCHQLEHLPKSPTGKIDRKKLADAIP